MFGLHQQVDPSSACTTLYNSVLVDGVHHSLHPNGACQQPLIVGLHYYQTWDPILKLAGLKSTLKYKWMNFFIYQNLTTEVLHHCSVCHENQSASATVFPSLGYILWPWMCPHDKSSAFLSEVDGQEQAHRTLPHRSWTQWTSVTHCCQLLGIYHPGTDTKGCLGKKEENISEWDLVLLILLISSTNSLIMHRR